MKISCWILIVGVCWAAPVYAENSSSPPLSELLKCRTVEAAVERLACYDGTSTKLQAAVQSKDLVVITRDDVRSAQRSLFGITAPPAKIFDRFGSRDLPQLDTVITSVSSGTAGLTFTVADGAVWQQTDDYPLPSIKAGRGVVIKHAALGSFFASFEKGPSIRVKRLR